MHSAICRTDWAPSSSGYRHYQYVNFEIQETRPRGLPPEQHYRSCIADRSSTKEVEIGGVKKRVCRLYDVKDAAAPVLSAVSLAFAPAYGAGRLAIVALTAPWRGIKESAIHFVRTIFLMLKYMFGQIVVTLECIFVSQEAMHGRQMIESAEQQMNQGVGLNESVWLCYEMKDFERSRDPGFYFMMCNQSSYVGILDERGNVVDVTGYEGSLDRVRRSDYFKADITCSHTFLGTREYKPRCWTQAFEDWRRKDIFSNMDTSTIFV